MKHLLSLLILTSSLYCYGQSHSTAYKKVVSLMKTELNYTYDSTSDVISKPQPQENTKDSNTIEIVDRSTLSSNPSPIIILNGTPTELAVFDEYKAEEIELHRTLSGTKATALYGARASNGVILIKRK